MGLPDERRPKRGEPPWEFGGGAVAGLGGPDGAHQGAGAPLSRTRHVGIVPHCLAGKVGSPWEPI